MRRSLSMMLLFALGVFWGVGELAPQGTSYATAWANTIGVSVEPPELLFTRGHTSTSATRWQDMPCRDNASGAFYESDILSAEEIEHYLVQAGFTPENAHTMMAIAKAESGHQLSCVGDEQLTDSKWTNSYGLYQIRGLKAEQGKGTCRDISSLGTDVLRQSQCAYEISSGGVNFRPWSMWLNGRYKEWL